MQSGFTALDAVVLAAYFVGTLWLGLKLGRKQKDARDYFVGDRRLPWWAVSFSVVATETSALTFISIPALAYVGNLGFLQIAFGYFIGRVAVSALLLPRYYQGELVTAYALLEQRFGVGTRRFASVTFMATRALAASVRVFATSIPLALLLGPILPAHWLAPTAILVLSAASVVYTYFGGTRAVVWTDVVQMTTYLLGGVAALVLLGMHVDGGWTAIFSRAGDVHKLKLINMSFELNDPHTLWAGLLGGGFLSMASHGADQLIVQRLLSARDLRDARRALLTDAVVVILQFALFLFVGVGLWAYYNGQTFAQSDRIFPTFIVTVMPPGLRGLIVAALTAAAMGTISNSLTALAAATTHDLWLPLSKRRAEDPETLRAGRRFTLIWAVVLIGAALLYREQGTPVVEIALAIASFTYGPLLGGFFLGILWKRARQFDAIAGMGVSLVVMTFVVFAARLSAWFPSLASTLSPLARISWPWYVLIGTAVTMIVGMSTSFFHEASSKQ